MIRRRSLYTCCKYNGKPFVYDSKEADLSAYHIISIESNRTTKHGCTIRAINKISVCVTLTLRNHL